MIAWMRGSSEMRWKVARKSSKWPERTVTWYRRMAVKTIHIIGNRPNAAPCVAARAANWTGIPKKTAATMIATRTALRPAQCAFHFRTPRVTNTVTSGRSAMSAERARLSATGDRSGW